MIDNTVKHTVAVIMFVIYSILHMNKSLQCVIKPLLSVYRHEQIVLNLFSNVSKTHNQFF